MVELDSISKACDWNDGRCNFGFGCDLIYKRDWGILDEDILALGFVESDRFPLPS